MPSVRTPCLGQKQRGITPSTRRRSDNVLSPDDREEISRCLAKQLTVRTIAARLSRAPSTVSREISRVAARSTEQPELTIVPGQRRGVRSSRCWREWCPVAITNSRCVNSGRYSSQYITAGTRCYARESLRGLSFAIERGGVGARRLTGLRREVSARPLRTRPCTFRCAPGSPSTLTRSRAGVPRRACTGRP